MSIFNNITKKVTETAKSAAKKSGDIVEVTKLNISITGEEEKIKRAYDDIGKIVYESFARGEKIADPFKQYCEKVGEYEKKIEEMRQKILELRNIKMCPECSTELLVEMAYCHTCGKKQELIQDIIESQDEDEAEDKGEEVQ